MSTGPESEHRPPALRIVRGDPTPEEIAALVTVLAAASGGNAQPTDEGDPVAQWAPPRRLLRPDVSATGWWESSLPR